MRRRLALLFTYLWRRLMVRTTVIAITGSVGKTTAKECLAAILGTYGPTLKTLENQNDQYGVPPTIRAIRPWHRFAVIEVGTGGPGNMRRLARLLKPDIAIVLRVARTHSDKFGNLENTAAEKAELLNFLPRRGLAILNADDIRVRAMADGCKARTVFFGAAPACDYRAESVESRWPERLRFTLQTGRQAVSVRTQLVGAHWVNSVLAALAAAEACGVPVEAAAGKLSQVPPFMGRMQPCALPSGAIFIRDEENGSPDTLEAMLEVLRHARATRRALVFSDQSDSKASPRQRLRYMGRTVAELCDLAVFVGAHAHHAVQAATTAGMDAACCRAFEDLPEAARWLRDILRPGDLVFLKGRSTDHLSRIFFAQFGPIGCWKSVCDIKRPCDVCSRLKPDFDLEKVLAASIVAERPS